MITKTTCRISCPVRSEFWSKSNACRRRRRRCATATQPFGPARCRRRNVFGETPVVGRYVADSPDRNRIRGGGTFFFLMERNGMRASSAFSPIYPCFRTRSREKGREESRDVTIYTHRIYGVIVVFTYSFDCFGLYAIRVKLITGAR